MSDGKVVQSVGTATEKDLAESRFLDDGRS